MTGAGSRGITTTFAVAGALAVLLSGCEGAEQLARGNRIDGRVLTIWVSVPLDGPSAVSGEAVERGAALALQQSGSRIGRFMIHLHTLDDSLPTTDRWNPGQTTSDARIAGDDPTTIGYIGELNSGASAVSIPLLNTLGIAQVTPGATAVGLTSDGAGANPGEPEKYYPTSRRTFVRVVPTDLEQARLQIALQRQLGCRATDVVYDEGEFDGEAAASTFVAQAGADGLRVVAEQPFEPRAGSYASLGQAISQSVADCLLIAAIPDSGTAALTDQLADAVPRMRLFATSALAQSSYTDPAAGGIALSVDPRILITAAAGDPADPTPEAATFYRDYTRRYGPPEPAAINGYEAMSLLLSAIRRATDDGHRRAERSRVVTALLSTRNRHSVLGDYSIEADGDTTLDDYGVYRVIDGRLRFWRSAAEIEAAS